MKFVLLSYVLLVTLKLTTSQVFQVNSAPREELCDIETVSKANRKFALELFQALAGDAEYVDENLFISPLVVSMGLTLTLLGAAGNTESELTTILGHGQNLSDEERRSLSCYFSKYIDERYTNELKTAARLFGQEDVKFLNEFLELSEKFGSRLEHVDFNNPASAADVINKWVSYQTNNRITKLVTESSIAQNTELILATAVYFKGMWMNRFTSNYTGLFARFVEGRFEQISNVNFMTETFKTKHFTDDDGWNFVELPYQSNGDDSAYSMILIKGPLQRGDQLDGVDFGNDYLYSSITRLLNEKPTEAIIHMPIFEISGEYDLTPYLRAMGIEELFTPAADLSGMTTNSNIYMSSAQHKTFLKVDQEGTEASAASVIGFLNLIGTPTYRFDSPFYLIIWDKNADSILFIGRITNPQD